MQQMYKIVIRITFLTIEGNETLHNIAYITAFNRITNASL